MKRISYVCALLLAVCFSGQAFANDAWKAKPMDWPHWRGPETNGISREKGLVSTWSPDGENLIWSSKELATRSTPICMNGKLYMLARWNPASEQEGEKIICADAATGKVLWENKFNVFLTDVPDTRVAWSSVVGDPETNRIYAQGVCGLFLCVDGETGKTIWQHSMTEEYGLLSTYGGRTNFPVLRGDLVLISAVIVGWGDAARPTHRFIAFDKRNGQPVWNNGTTPLPYDTTYSTPVVSNYKGSPIMVFGSGDGGVHAMQPNTGVSIWSYPISYRGVNISPVIAGDNVIAGHSEENIDTSAMGALLALPLGSKGVIKAGGGEAWRDVEYYSGKSSPLVLGERVYAIDDSGNLAVADVKTGKFIGKKQKLGTQGRGSPVYADGKIYCCEGNGRWYIFELDEAAGVKKIHTTRLTGEIDASPIISHGRIYLSTSEMMYCIGDKDAKPSADPRPEPPAEAPVEEDSKATHLQVVPCESLLRSGPKGQAQRHVVRLYNSRGQFLKTVDPKDVQFSVAGAGKVDAQGRFETPTENIHGTAIVTAKVGELTGTTRIRVTPDLPWSFDFSDGAIPASWVGMRYRNIVTDWDLLKKLEEKNETTARLYIYLLSAYVNSGKPITAFDNTTPDQRWTEFLRFVRLLESVKTVDEAKAAIDPMLTALKEEQVVSEWTWEDLGEKGPKLTVKQGARKLTGAGNLVATKITTIPKGTRSFGTMGRPDLSNYTIQSDVNVAQRNGKIGDVGVIAQRYRLDLMGQAQELKIISWISHEIKFKTIKFPWKANTWYTMKLTATSKDKDGKRVAVLNGKVWPREEKEPADWTITWEDEPANEIGSPGLFGNAGDAEVFYDNIKVTAN